MKEILNLLNYNINRGKKIIPLHNENRSHLNLFNQLVVSYSFNNLYLENNKTFIKNKLNISIDDFKEIEQDAKNYSKNFLNEIDSIGSYTSSFGSNFVRNKIISKLNEENNTNLNIEDIFWTEGVSNSLSKIFSIFFLDNKDVIFIPKIDKGYYKEIVEFKNGTYDYYEYDENKNMDINLELLENKIKNLEKKNLKPKGILISHPCNPIGKIFNKDKIKEIIKFCYFNNLVIIVDESLNENKCFTNKFFSFSKVWNEMEEDIKNNQEIIIVNSLRFGFYNTPGLNSGYINTINLDKDVKLQIKKFLSINLNPNCTGQLILSLWANNFKSKEFNETTKNYMKNYNEKKNNEKKNKIEKINNYLQNSKNFKNYKIDTDYFLFPKINKIKNDFEFCKKLLTKKNVLIVPGSIFFNEKNEENNKNVRISLNQKLEFILEGLNQIESLIDEY